MNILAVILATASLSNLVHLAESNLRTISYNVIYGDNEHSTSENEVIHKIFEYHNTTKNKFADDSMYMPTDEINTIQSLRQLQEEDIDIIGEDTTVKFEQEDKAKIGFFIVGGNEVTINEFKENYQSICSILKARTVFGQTYVSHACGCTLIAPNVVLTAAHCGTFAHYVQVGKLYQSPSMNTQSGLNVETFKVIQTKYHKEWSRSTFNYDVMLLKLSGKTTKPVMKLQLSSEKRSSNDYLRIVGWGTTSSYSSTSSNAMRDVDVQFLDKDVCKNEFYGNAVRESMMCAYRPGKDACQGDSGGPLLKKGSNGEFIQVGIVSWGYLCAVYPGVYCDLSSTSSISSFIHEGVCNRHGFNPHPQSCHKGKMRNVV